MRTYIKEHELFGKTLFAEHSDISIGIPLEYGLRIAYLSYKGSENLFFEQPKDMTALTTPNGWRVRGGHRLWIAPESKDIYYPDNEPISYNIEESCITIRQNIDPWIDAEKTMMISFISDDSVKIKHLIKNLSDSPRTFSLWGVTSVAPFGTQKIPLYYAESGSAPLHKFATWYYTNIGDERATYKRDLITLKHKSNDLLYKIGIGHPAGAISYTNKGVIFEKSFEIYKDENYPDGNVSYETYMCNYMAELESLSPLRTVASGQSAEHIEIWNLRNAD